MGVGKTTIGRQLARQLKMKFVDSDREIERRTGATINLIFDIEGERGFRDREERILAELCVRENTPAVQVPEEESRAEAPVAA